MFFHKSRTLNVFGQFTKYYPNELIICDNWEFHKPPPISINDPFYTYSRIQIVHFVVASNNFNIISLIHVILANQFHLEIWQEAHVGM